MGDAPAGDRRPMRQSPRKVRLPKGHSRSGEQSFSDERWTRIRGVIPNPLSADLESRFRQSICDCCNKYLGGLRLVDEGAATAAAVRRGGGKQAAPLERLITSRKIAATAWTEVRGMHDDRLGILSDGGDRLADMAADAERRLRDIRSLSETKPADIKNRTGARLGRVLPARSGNSYCNGGVFRSTKSQRGFKCSLSR